MVINFILSLEYAIGHIAIEHIDRFTVLLHGDVGSTCLVLVKRCVAVKAYDLVSIPRGCQRCLPPESIACTIEVDCVESELEAAVADLACVRVGCGGVLVAGSDRNRCLDKHVGRILQICIDRKVDTRPPHGQVKTNVCLAHFLPVD